MWSAVDPFARLVEQLDTEQVPLSLGEGSHAAVLIALTQTARPEVVLTQRAQHLRKHAGEVALPGGKWESGDHGLWQTALRESQEEVALNPEMVTYLGHLPMITSRYGLSVLPFVGLIPTGLKLTPNLDELDRIFKVPLDYFAEPGRLGVRQVERDGLRYHCPSFHYGEYEVWGLTAAILLRLVYRLDTPPQDVDWSDLFKVS